MTDATADVAAAIAAVRNGDRVDVEPDPEDDHVGFLDVSEAGPAEFEVAVEVSVSKTDVPDDVVPVAAVDDPGDATALVDALGREGVFAELVEAVSTVYDLPEGTVAERLEADLHCTRAWPDQPAVSNVRFGTRLAGGPGGLRSERLHADELWY